MFTLLLVMALAAVALPAMPAAAMPLPWQRPTADTRPAAVNRGLATLQEVSPPAAVQQLQSALAGRQPVVEILTPQDDATLPPGPWTLKLRVHDWPLVDGGDLGPGPHLVVQLDQEPPQIWTRSEGMMPELSPGSHLLSVYAAQPWGEARKNPGAVRQIRLHRTAANPLSLPAAGSPQLLAVSPSGSAGEEPLLLDWLLLDAPLQDVGGSGTQWRLRVTINDDAVLLDQQTPLWLQGWRPGRNALRLELLDARGEPLNPPFNSLVREVDVHRTEPPRRWGGPPLSGSELAILLGEAPAAPPTQPQPTEADAKASRPGVSTDAETGAASEPQAPQAEQAMAEPEPVTTPASPERAPDQEKPAAEPRAQGDARPTESAAPMAVEQPAADNTRSSSETPLTAQNFVAPEDPAANPTPAPATSLTAEEPRSDSGAPIHAPPRDTMTAASSTAPPQAPPPTASSAEQTSPPITEAAPSSDSRDAEPIRPSSQLTGRARDLVNDDGTLRQPEQRTALAGLRDWLKR